MIGRCSDAGNESRARSGGGVGGRVMDDNHDRRRQRHGARDGASGLHESFVAVDGHATIGIAGRR